MKNIKLVFKQWIFLLYNVKDKEVIFIEWKKFQV